MVMKNDLGKIYDIYFNEVTYSIESRIFDVIGHFDLLSSYIGDKEFLDKFDNWDKVKTVLGEIVERKEYLEINSKRLRETGKDTTPSRKIVKEFIENEGKQISIGSDAHSIEEIGSGIQEILSLLANFNRNKVKLFFE